jgi:multiple sugar transport system substrate-binding protein
MNLHLSRSTLLVSFLAAALLLAGCGSLEPQSPTGTPEGTPPPPKATFLATNTPHILPSPDQANQYKPYLSELEGVRLELWHPFSGKMAGLLSDLANEFSRENEWGIRAEVITKGGGSQLTEAMDQPGDGGLPQVVLAASAHLNGWMQSGRLADLNEYLELAELGMDADLLQGYNPAFWQQDQFAGSQAGIPALRTAYGLFYNQSWAEELGFTRPPATPDEFQEQACAAALDSNRSKFLEKRGTGGWLVDLSPETALSWFQAFDGQVLPESETQSFRFNQDKAKDALEFLNEMQAGGCLWIGLRADTTAYFSDRYALFASGSLQDLSAQQKRTLDHESEDDWLFIPYPEISGQPFIYAEGYSYGLLKADPKTQLAGWLFIRWLNLPENQARIAELFPSLPVNTAWKAQTVDDRANFPWTQILPLEKQEVLPAPWQPSWIIARRPVEDAFWQVFNLAEVEQLNDILPELDALIREQLSN